MLPASAATETEPEVPGEMIEVADAEPLKFDVPAVVQSKVVALTKVAGEVGVEMFEIPTVAPLTRPLQLQVEFGVKVTDVAVCEP